MGAPSDRADWGQVSGGAGVEGSLAGATYPPCPRAQGCPVCRRTLGLPSVGHVLREGSWGLWDAHGAPVKPVGKLDKKQGVLAASIPRTVALQGAVNGHGLRCLPGEPAVLRRPARVWEHLGTPSGMPPWRASDLLGPRKSAGPARSGCERWPG